MDIHPPLLLWWCSILTSCQTQRLRPRSTWSHYWYQPQQESHDKPTSNSIVRHSSFRLVHNKQLLKHRCTHCTGAEQLFIWTIRVKDVFFHMYRTYLQKYHTQSICRCNYTTLLHYCRHITLSPPMCLKIVEDVCKVCFVGWWVLDHWGWQAVQCSKVHSTHRTHE